MADCLQELEQVLRQGKLTIDEAKVLLQYKARALRDFSVGVGVGAGVVWLATRKLSIVHRLPITGGAAAFTGFWRFKESLHSRVQHILGLEGSRMQVELARIILRKHPNDEITRKLISKHFYPENVFDDLTSQLKREWRQRNFFVDSAADHVKTRNSDYGHDDVDVEPKHISMNSVFVSMANPFDCVFGLPTRVEEMQPTVTSTKSPRKQRRCHKRSHHKHRVHNQEAA